MTVGNLKKPSKANDSNKRQDTTVLQALQQVRELIVLGKLSPGTRIVEEELAQRLNVSRTPVRAVLQWLQQEGYVREQRTATKSRMIVSPLTKEDAAELYSVIGRLEGLAGRITAMLPKPERVSIIQRLEILNRQLSDVRTKPSKHGAIFDIDRDFHRLIVESGAGPRLRAWHQTIEPQVERYWRLYASSITTNLQLSVNEHQDIITALAEGNADRMERSLQLNWENGCERVAKIMDVFGERGSW